ncbi:MAG TPA: crosslink repair DNA glycosylase YcaQ family protein, partial [Rhodoglobus sp.]|nr:crosslink repair DNA glycosylase YcaQ family protein [Rhodoglobus sp.]
MVESISAAQARRVALAAQGFGARPDAVGTRRLNLALRRLAVLQLDSVNVFERSHYLPLFARLGPYDRALLDRLTFTRRSPYIEYWAHQASLIPIEEWPLWGFRRRFYREVKPKYVDWAAVNTRMLEFVLGELAERGPLTAGQIEHEESTRKGPWWGWSEVKTALELLVDRGEVVVSHRRNFERFYDLPERKIPREVLEQQVDETDALRQLVRTSIRALGVGTVRDIADYYRLLQEQVKPALADLVDAGEVLPVRVRGWERPAAFLHAGARIPRRIEGTALL